MNQNEKEMAHEKDVIKKLELMYDFFELNNISDKDAALYSINYFINICLQYKISSDYILSFFEKLHNNYVKEENERK